MPLSEEELRLLEQMERALVAEDPKLASTLRGSGLLRRARRQLILSGIGFILGIAMLMSGVVFQITVVGIIGFVVMLASAYIGLEGWRSHNQAANDPTAALGGKSKGKSKGAKPANDATFMDRFEERWKKRRDGDESF